MPIGLKRNCPTDQRQNKNNMNYQDKRGTIILKTTEKDDRLNSYGQYEYVSFYKINLEDSKWIHLVATNCNDDEMSIPMSNVNRIEYS